MVILKMYTITNPDLSLKPATRKLHQFKGTLRKAGYRITYHHINLFAKINAPYPQPPPAIATTFLSRNSSEHPITTLNDNTLAPEPAEMVAAAAAAALHLVTNKCARTAYGTLLTATTEALRNQNSSPTATMHIVQTIEQAGSLPTPMPLQN